MCKIGDIILVESYFKDSKIMEHHSFIVVGDEAGQIQGLDYDLICNVMSSFKDEEQKKKKLSFPCNYPIKHTDTNVVGNKKDGYTKTEQFYYFNKQKIDYKIIGSVNIDVFNDLIKFIEEMNKQIEHIMDNLI